MSISISSELNTSISSHGSAEISGYITPVTPELLSQRIPGWHALSTSAPWCEPFFQPEWFNAFANTFANTHPIYLLNARTRMGLVGIAPLMRTNSFFGCLPARTYRSLSGIHSCRYDLIHAHTCSLETARTLWGTLQADPWWDVIEALDVPNDGGFTMLLTQARKSGFLVGIWPTRKSPLLPLSTNGADPLMHCPSEFRSLRSNLARKLRRLQKTGHVSFSSSREPHPGLEEFLHLEASGWKGARGSAIASRPTTRDFYARVVEAFSRLGTLRFHTLSVDSKPIAMQLGLLMNGVYYVPKTTYDEGFAQFSPSQLLVHHVLSELPEQKVHTYDFLGPRAWWKSVWTSRVREHCNYYIFRPTTKGRLLHFTVMTAASRLRTIRHRIWGDPQAILNATTSIKP